RAARQRAKTNGDRRRGGERNDDVVGIDLPGVGDDLREDRLHALPLRAGARRDVDLAGRIDPHQRALERSDPGALDIAADAEPEMAAGLARFRLALAECFEAAARGERLLQPAGI